MSRGLYSFANPHFLCVFPRGEPTSSPFITSVFFPLFSGMVVSSIGFSALLLSGSQVSPRHTLGPPVFPFTLFFIDLLFYCKGLYVEISRLFPRLPVFLGPQGGLPQFAHPVLSPADGVPSTTVLFYNRRFPRLRVFSRLACDLPRIQIPFPLESFSRKHDLSVISSVSPLSWPGIAP